MPKKLRTCGLGILPEILVFTTQFLSERKEKRIDKFIGT